MLQLKDDFKKILVFLFCHLLLVLLGFFYILVPWPQYWYHDVTGSWTHYWSESLFPDKTIKLCLSFAKRQCWEASLHTVRTSVLSVLWWRSGVMKDNADNWSFVWRTSSPKYHSGKVSSQLLMLRHPPLGDLVFPSRDVLTAFAKTSASREPSLRCFRCSTLGFPATSLLYLSTVSTASSSG